MYANIRGLRNNLSDLSLIARGSDASFSVPRLLSLLGATFQSVRLQVLANRCSCLGVTLIDFECWLYACVMAFWHIDSAVTSMDIVKSQLSEFVVCHNFYVVGVYRNPDVSDKIL